MATNEIDSLLSRPPDHELTGLEAAIWRGVDLQAKSDRRFMAMSALQAGALAITIVGAAAWGSYRAEASVDANGLGAFSSQMALAPSSRLTG